ncbi:MAG: peptidoglycan DD-metalloendopeptidase family protein [Pseudomonadota bacterium]|nr:peptidoglycan DD-metalloendopeptidase family protein [Pseudomonadota bacterium]
MPRLLHISGLVVLCHLALTLAPTAGAAKDQDLDAVQRQIAVVNRWLKTAKRDEDQQARALREVETRIANSSQALRALEAEARTLQRKRNGLLAQREQLGAQLQVHRQALVGALRAAHRSGEASQLRVLLSGENPTDMARMARYLDAISRRRSAQIAAFREDLAALAQVESEAQAAHQALAVNTEAQRDRLAQLEVSREERTAALQALRAGIRDQTDELAALRENERHLQSLLDAVVEASRELQQSGRGDPFASRKGQLPWPLHGAIQNAFGSRDRRTGLVRKGLLIQANDGAPVHAIHRGHVLFADWVRGVGLLIIIDHDQGFLSLYAHNQTLLKSAGDWVEAGETIAAAGNTGGQREANLYFEIRRDGKPVDPVAWLQSRR